MTSKKNQIILFYCCSTKQACGLVEWSCFFKVLKEFSFSERLIDWIKTMNSFHIVLSQQKAQTPTISRYLEVSDKEMLWLHFF